MPPTSCRAGRHGSRPPPSDQQPDTLPWPVGACSTNAQVVGVYASTMVICQSTIGQVYTQCDANQNLCNTNSWQLCGTDDFLDRGGSSTPAPFGVEAWIGSWINHDPVLLSYQPPLTGNAPCTLPATIDPVAVAWACKGGSKLGHFQSYALLRTRTCTRGSGSSRYPTGS